jgi:hypothetical protein
MSKPAKPAFEFDGVMVKLDRLLPTKQVKEAAKQSAKYKAILASIREVGIIEPLIVHRQKGGRYLLLDGHERVEALKELGIGETLCLVSTDDEGYTYNRQVNRVAPVQANRMVLKALDAGVKEHRIAKALNLSLSTIRENRRMLQGICPEALDLLKDTPAALQTFRELKKVKPIRQIEMVELMTSAGNYGGAYARALVVATQKEHLVEPEKPKKIPGVKPDDLARMEHEMRMVEKDFLLLDETYGRNVMDLTLARAYLKKLLENAKVVRYLAQKHRDVLAEFQRIGEAISLEGS